MNRVTMFDKKLKWTNTGLLACLLVTIVLFIACTKEGDTIYQADPNEPKASTAPLVTVIYGTDALGDRSYSDLIYQGVEEAAVKCGLRTMQLSPTSYQEGLGYLQSMFQTVKSQSDTIRRLFIVEASGYDDYIRQNSHLFDSNPYADLLYLETPEPLASGCSTLYLPYYGAMYEAGAILPALSRDASLILSNPEDQTVVGAAKGFTDGFYADYYRVDASDRHLKTIYLAQKAGEGYNIPDSTAIRILNQVTGTIVPICGGSGYTMMYLCDVTLGSPYVSIDVERSTFWCHMSVFKHIDRAVSLCIGQWCSPEGMPKHQVLGLKEGYTGVEFCPVLDDLYIQDYNKYISEALRQQIHEDAIRKEEAYENQ